MTSPTRYNSPSEERDNVVQLFRATLDASNPISVLRGNALVMSTICAHLDTEWYKKHVDETSIAFLRSVDSMHRIHPFANISRYRDMSVLPPPSGRDIDVNMMPINLVHLDVSLPDFLKNYTKSIRACLTTPYNVEDRSERIAYLTVQEGMVPVGRSQRRPGLHIDRHNNRIRESQGGGEASTAPPCHPWRQEDPALRALSARHYDTAWGLGKAHHGLGGAYHGHTLPIDGIFMASSVANSCAVWPRIIYEPEKITDEHGGIEHLRELLGEPVLLGADELCWLTDRTPHESLPLYPIHNGEENDEAEPTHVFRQFFRLVAGPVSVWYTKHNTPNPTGTLPGAEVEIDDGDKFVDRV